MCYFIHLAITPQKRSDDAETTARVAAKEHQLKLYGQFPNHLTITDGHCSCHFLVRNGVKAPVAAFLRDLVQAKPVKNIQVGWIFGNGMPVMPVGAVVERLTLAEFISRNEMRALTPEIWYRLYAPEKYHF